MSTFEDHLAALDLELFARIPAQLTDADRRSLLAVQHALRERIPHYTYLEIGSHLGGSIQPHLLDERCGRIYSIDKRPLAVADERGYKVPYPENSTAHMLKLLREVNPQADERIICFDADASGVDPAAIAPSPHLCLIDGEHTDRAATADYAFCRKVMGEHGVVLFHDGNIIYSALAGILESLGSEGTPFHAYALPSSVFVIEFGEVDLHKSAPIARMLIDNHEQYLFGLLSLEHYREVYNRKPIRMIRAVWQAWLSTKHALRGAR